MPEATEPTMPQAVKDFLEGKTPPEAVKLRAPEIRVALDGHNTACDQLTADRQQAQADLVVKRFDKVQAAAGRITDNLALAGYWRGQLADLLK
jgi:hypothetical protein